MIPLALAPLVAAVLGALGGAIGVTVAFSLVIFGVVRVGDMRRTGRAGAATAYGALSVVAGIAAVGVVALGLVWVTSK